MIRNNISFLADYIGTKRHIYHFSRNTLLGSIDAYKKVVDTHGSPYVLACHFIFTEKSMPEVSSRRMA